MRLINISLLGAYSIASRGTNSKPSSKNDRDLDCFFVKGDMIAQGG